MEAKKTLQKKGVRKLGIYRIQIKGQRETTTNMPDEFV